VRREQDQYKTVGVVKAVTMSNRRHPVVMMINRNIETGDMSFQFGLLRRGHVDMVRYWREDSLLQIAMLAKIVAEVSFAKQLGSIEFSGATLQKLVDDIPVLEWVDACIPGGKQKKVSMSIGDRVKTS